MTFAFDEKFTMFDVTPVENQFILEQLPGAKGDYIKVYLYGLMYCYHPREDVTTESMSRDLDMPEEDIKMAFRYWERHGAVRRICDHPPAWEYVNFKQRSSSSVIDVDPDYAAFCSQLESAFEGHVFRGSDMAAIYEWKEGSMQLPTEVILMLLHHILRKRTRSFKLKDAERLALRLAEENARTEETAAIILARDEKAAAGMQAVLKKMGKRYFPSDANINLYLKWTREWGFTKEAIETACETMETKDPSLDFLDKILETAYNEKNAGKNKALEQDDILQSNARHQNVNTIMKALGRSGRFTEYQEHICDDMLGLYPVEIILLGAEECRRKNRDPESLLEMLNAWKERGFTSADQVKEHIRTFREKEAFMKKIRARWSSWEADPGERHIEMLTRWEEKLGISRELILKAADYAVDVRKPMTYLDKLMTRYAEKGIRSTEEAERDRLEHLTLYQEMAKNTAEKNNPAVHYSQRDYSGEQDAAMERLMNWSGKKDDA